jgi:hypothetical protein
MLTTTLLLASFMTQAEIYRHTDERGRQYFSDSPQGNYQSSGYSSVKGQKLDYKALDQTAKRLKKDRLQRELERKKALAKSNKQRKKQQKLLAAAEKRKKACYLARKKEVAAFRKRTKRQSLNQMRNALSNYERKHEARIAKCS